MKLKQLIYIAALALLTACHDDVPAPTYTVGEAVNAITLHAGISEGGEGVTTRAAEDHHTTPGHVNFTSGTQLRLRVDGTWLGKGFTNNLVTKTTTGTTGAKTGNGELHNEVSFSTTSSPVEQLYWDDYGTADPNNIDAPTGTATSGTGGRGKGLTIYGVAINGVTPAPAVSDWTSISWELPNNQTGGWAEKDLLTSNNITSTGDGTYKFDDYVNDLKNSTTTASNLLEFTHAMTKITVNLTAGEGFPGYETGAENAKFQTAPTVKLLSFNYTGTVNVETKISTPTSATTTNINMHLAEGGANNNKAKYDALVFPGNQFTATIGASPEYKPTSTIDILELNADGNIYKITAAQLVKAIVGTNVTGTSVNGTLEQGKNYILNIIVDKTKIHVTATIKDWIDVTAASETPKINVSATYGYTTLTGTHSFENDFSFFRSGNKESGYMHEAVVSHSSGQYVMTPQLYWPNHQTHYFFRGVYPKVGTETGNTPSGSFTTSTSSASTITVSNVLYEEGKYPSDLAIAFPRGTTEGSFDETCKVHTSTPGICATEGAINMNFQYAMSQVEVELQTVDDPVSAKVNIDENTVVELVNVYNSGEVKLSDGSVTTSDDKGSYTLNTVTGNGNELKRHSAIVPQTLTFSTAGASTNVRFKITVTNNDAVLYADETEYNAAKGTTLDATAFAALSEAEKTKTPATTDVYYADVEPIKKTGSTDNVAPNGKWESGIHYKYVLTLSKTAVTVTATLKDWVKVTANDVIWF